MRHATVAILYAPGTNCHEETAAAIEFAGGESELLLLHDLIHGEKRLGDYQAAVIPGGFSYGDHLGAGRVFAAMLVAQLREELASFLAAGKPLLGICNGFQVLAETGFLPGRTPGKRAMALVENQSSRFEDRRVRLLVSNDTSLWTRSLAGQILEMPSAHGEGRLLCFEKSNLLESARVAFHYADAAGRPTEHYPENPSGASGGVAGITDSTGRVLGLMPHPERASLPAHESQDGLKLFQNLIAWLR